jgi:hypothetical protein
VVGSDEGMTRMLADSGLERRENAAIGYVLVG